MKDMTTEAIMLYAVMALLIAIGGLFVMPAIGRLMTAAVSCPECTSELVPMQPVVQQPLAPGHYVVTDGVLVKQPEPLENHQL